MRREVRETRGTSSPLEAQAFLRSINLRYDAKHADRIGHFQPTAKTVGLVRQLLGEDSSERALLVVAPYGSGKSLAASYVLQLTENRIDAENSLVAIEQRLKPVSPDLAKFARRRRTKRGAGFVLALHGYQPSIGEALKGAASDSMRRQKQGRRARTIEGLPTGTPDEVVHLLSVLQKKATDAGRDRIVILWDEFGRHLEGLLADGRASELLLIQQLAEFASRTSNQVPITLGLLLHRNLLNYAASLPHSVRSEWKKIEGRFHTIQYVDDSKEIHRLITEILSSRFRNGQAPRPKGFSSLARRARQLGLFSDYSEKELTDLLAKGYPIEPTTLHLLPRLSARVAQNERTLFSFLFGVDPDRAITPSVLYDYFSSEMQSDSTVGGTYKQWLETQSAISKTADDPKAVAALKTACLLGLGLSGERSRAGKNHLLFALGGLEATSSGEVVVESLIDKKLLLHRQHSDEVAVWHGTDLDLRGRLQEEEHRLKEHFEIIDFLTREVPPPTWKPLRYNDQFHVRRYATSTYISLGELKRNLQLESHNHVTPPGCDARVLYLVPTSPVELEEAESVIRDGLKNNRLLVAIPRGELNLFGAALEVAAIQHMQVDSELLESDPLAAAELQQMSDDSRDHLDRMAEGLTNPSDTGCRWFYQGNELTIHSPKALRGQLSEVMEQVFPSSPKIRNEMIVRRNPSAILVNARKKLLLGILDRTGEENLGIIGNFPDASMFRTVLFNTGIYRQSTNGLWGYSMPECIEDEGLQAVWQEIRDFLSLPNEQFKKFEDLFDRLASPPFGVRAGVLPILLAAGLKAFPSATTLLRGGEYVPDILPSVIEHLCKHPQSYNLKVLDLDTSTKSYLGEVSKILGEGSDVETYESDLLRRAFEAWESWKATLPVGARTTRLISERTRKLQDLLGRRLEPAELFLARFPDAMGCDGSSDPTLTKKIKMSLHELETIADQYAAAASTTLKRKLGMGEASEKDSARRVAETWADLFPTDLAPMLPDPSARALMNLSMRPYRSDSQLVNALSSVLIAKPLSAWDDRSLLDFEQQLNAAVQGIEDHALTMVLEGPQATRQEARSALGNILKRRIARSFGILGEILGESEARTFIQSLDDHPSED